MGCPRRVHVGQIAVGAYGPHDLARIQVHQAGGEYGYPAPVEFGTPVPEFSHHTQNDGVHTKQVADLTPVGTGQQVVPAETALLQDRMRPFLADDLIKAGVQQVFGEYIGDNLPRVERTLDLTAIDPPFFQAVEFKVQNSDAPDHGGIAGNGGVVVLVIEGAAGYQQHAHNRQENAPWHGFLLMLRLQ